MISDAVGEAVATEKFGVDVAIRVAVDPPHANPVITSAASREIKMRLFISFTHVLIGFPGKAQNNNRL